MAIILFIFAINAGPFIQNHQDMAKNYFNRYVWLIDTINRYGHISREEIGRLWKGSNLNETGEDLYEKAAAVLCQHRE